MKEGFFIGGGFIFVGLLLEQSVGPVAWDAFRWPANGLALTGLIGVIATICVMRKKMPWFQLMSSYNAAVPALVFAVALTVIMGLTRQTDEGGTWLNDMLTFWPFVLIYVYIALILGCVLMKQLLTWSAAHFSFSSLGYSLLFHFGLFLSLTTATLGSADRQCLKMIAVKGTSEWRAFDRNGLVRDLPIAIELKEFFMETYDSGAPKRYASDIQVQTETGQKVRTVVEVNKPARLGGWTIYQYDYDTEMGAKSRYSVLELVRDPWLPLVYVGILMMLVGAVCLFVLALPWRGLSGQIRKNPKGALGMAVLIGTCLFCVHHFMPILHSKTLVPALQSPWFVPHIIAYMVAYALLGAAALMAVWILLKNKVEALSLNNLVYMGLAFMTIGMLLGALWAQDAWGHYWAWDPKETWAVITWFSYLVYVHYRHMPAHRPKFALWMLIVSFLLLQMCWWGIKYLPSAQGASVHVYS